MYLLDANIVIALIASNPAVLRRLARCDRGEVAMSSIVYAEVAVGIERQPLDRDPVRALLKAIVVDVRVVPFDTAAAQAYARLPFRRRSFDLLIAAHALALDASLVTANTRDFGGLDGLHIEDWSHP